MRRNGKSGKLHKKARLTFKNSARSQQVWRPVVRVTAGLFFASLYANPFEEKSD